MDLVNLWLAPIALLVSIINTVGIWVSRPGKIAKERHEALKDWAEKSIGEFKKESAENFKSHDRRIQSLESDQRHLPTKDDLHELSEQVAKLEARFESDMETLGTTVRRIDDYLRSKS